MKEIWKCRNFTRTIKVCSKGPKKTTCRTEKKEVCKVKFLHGKCANVTEVRPNSCKRYCQGGEGRYNNVLFVYLEGRNGGICCSTIIQAVKLWFGNTSPHYFRNLL